MKPTDSRATIEGEIFASLPRSIEYLSVATPEPGGYVEVAPGILWLRIPLPMELNHINLWLLQDGDGWTLVDSGLNAEPCRAAWEALEKQLFSQRPLKRIFLTHLHPDHIGLAHWLQERHNVPVIMGMRGFAQANFFAREPMPADIESAQNFLLANGYRDIANMSKFLGGKGFRSGISGLPSVSAHLTDGDCLSVDGADWQIYETDGHAEGHQCLYNAQRQILISGDQILPSISPNISYSPRATDKNPLKSFLESLARLAKLDAKTLVLPSHGRPFFGLQSRAADLMKHHNGHLDAIRTACITSQTAFDLVPVIFHRKLIGMHWMFAMGEIIAHVEYLALSGELRREVDMSTQEIRYCSA